MPTGRVVELRVSGLRAIARLELDLSGLSVLIGDNGSGKSTVLLALDLLRHAASPVSFLTDVVNRLGGGLRSLLRYDAKELRIGATVEAEGNRIDYDFTIVPVGYAADIQSETLVVQRPGAEPVRLLERDGAKAALLEDSGNRVALRVTKTELFLGHMGISAPPPVVQLTQALAAMDLQVAFETRPLWQADTLRVHVRP